MSFQLDELCNKLGVSYTGDGDTLITQVCGIDQIGSRANALSYVTNSEELANLPVPDGIFECEEKDLSSVRVHRQSAVVVPESYSHKTSNNLIFSKDPLATHVQATLLLHQPVAKSNLISPEASIGENVKLGKAVTIDPRAVIYDNVAIGDHSVIRAGVVVMNDSTIGKHCIIHPNVSVSDHCTIGNNVILHSNVVIGSDGFGYYQRNCVNVKIPQVGGVIIEDDVEIGAGSAIDRARFYNTIIRKGSKFDNLVHIAHNVEVGEHSFIAGQSGIAGSTRTGHHLIMGGQSGIRDNLEIGDHVTLLARTAVLADTKSNSTMAGMPARPFKKWKKNQALLNSIDRITNRLKKLEKLVHKLTSS